MPAHVAKLVKKKCNMKSCLSNTFSEDKTLFCDPSFIPTIASEIKPDSVQCKFYSTDKEKEVHDLMNKKNQIKELMKDEPAPKKNIKKQSDDKPKKRGRPRKS
jgi:hypothetical protein